MLINKKLSSKKGFSLTELLTAVAILVILFGLFSVNVVRYVKSTTQTRLDKIAETVYVTAQNNITKINSAGRIDEISYDDGSKVKRNSSSVPTTFPSGRTLEYLSVDDSLELTRLLVPEGSIDGNYKYYIEYDAESADAFSVFVYEDDSLNFYPDNASSYRTSKEQRIANGYNVGYYEGSVRPLTIGTSKDYKLTCDTVIVNKEILQDDIYVNLPIGCGNDEVKLTITIKGEKSGKIKTIEYSDSSSSYPALIPDSSNPNSRIRKYSLILDKLTEDDDVTDLSFKGQYGGIEGFYPGENITVSVVAEDVSNNMVAATKPISDTVNSLFNSVNGNNVGIYYIRHLENLSDYDTSHLDNINVIQERKLDFNNTAVDEYADVYGSRKHTPINNVDIDSYDGNDYLISNLKTSGSVNAGLFGEFNGKTLSNIVLVNASAAGTNNVGALAGVINNATEGQITVANCYSYLNSPIYEFTDQTYLNGSVCGGLIGTIANSTNNTLSIENCFASTTIDADTYAGGLIGKTDKSINIQTSYADSYMSGTTVGGLAGGLGGTSTISSSYAAGFLIGDATTVAGITPSSIASINQSYTVLSYNDYSATNKLSTIGGGATTSTYYLKMENITVDKGAEASIDDFINAKDRLTLGNSFSYANNSAYPYNLYDKFLSDSYPYPAIASINSINNHYGDWEETEIETVKYTVKLVYGNGQNDYSFNVGIDRTFNVPIPTRAGYSFMGWTIEGMDETEHTIGSTLTTETYLEEEYATSYSHLRETEGTVTFKADWLDEKEGRVTFYSREKGSKKQLTFADGKYRHVYDTHDTQDEQTTLAALLGSLDLLEQENVLQEGYILTGFRMERSSSDTLKWSDITNNHITINVEDNDWTFDVTAGEAEAAKVEISSNDLLFSEWGNASKVKFYSIYELKKYTITYDFNTGTVDETLNPKEYTIETETITLKNPTKNHYDFVGWYNVETDKKVETIPKGSTGNLNLKAKWIPHEYSITYKDSNKTITGLIPSHYNIEDGAVLPTDAAKTGYKFVAWYDNSEFSGEAITNISTGEYGDKTYYAKYNQLFDIKFVSTKYNNEKKLIDSSLSSKVANGLTLSDLNVNLSSITKEAPGWSLAGYYYKNGTSYTKVVENNSGTFSVVPNLSIAGAPFKTSSTSTFEDVSGAIELVAKWVKTGNFYIQTDSFSGSNLLLETSGTAETNGNSLLGTGTTKFRYKTIGSDLYGYRTKYEVHHIQGGNNITNPADVSSLVFIDPQFNQISDTWSVSNSRLVSQNGSPTEPSYKYLGANNTHGLFVSDKSEHDNTWRATKWEYNLETPTIIQDRYRSIFSDLPIGYMTLQFNNNGYDAGFYAAGFQRMYIYKYVENQTIEMYDK